MMAEFQEVMRQLNRLCNMCDDCNKECPVRAVGACGNIGLHCSEPLQIERIEKTVMQWAAEHPEPVYPTWYEFLTSRYYKAWEAIGCDEISADIAQKLGIEPKEG